MLMTDIDRGMPAIAEHPGGCCRRCREYKGLFYCESCGKIACVFCDGDERGMCPDCDEDVDLVEGL